MVFTTSGILTEQCWCNKQFRNAADGFRNAIDGLERPEMGLGLVRDCSGEVWTASKHD